MIDVPGRPYPIEVRYEPRVTLAGAVRSALERAGGHVLCFLPGAPEIRRAQAEIGTPAGARVLPLHGTLSAEEQDLALAPSAERKVILATNVAETSLTVEGVTDVIDSGQHKVLRYDPSRGLDRLELERIPADSAEQRAGRAGRTGPGRVVRLWDERDRLRPRREPEIERVDLAGPLLDVLAWGGDVAGFEWFEAPPPEAVAAGMTPPRAARRGVGWTADGRRARRCTGCLSTRGSRACCSRPAAARERPPSAPSWARGGGRLSPATRRRPTPTCSRPRTVCVRRRRE